MIDKFAEIKKILKLRNACSGILRVKVAGLLEKQAKKYGVDDPAEYERILRDIRDRESRDLYDDSRYNAYNAPNILKLYKEYLVRKDPTVGAALLNAFNAANPGALGPTATVDDLVNLLGEEEKRYKEHSDLEKYKADVFRERREYEARLRGGSRGGPRRGSRITVRMGDGSIRDWYDTDGPLPPDATPVSPAASPTSAIEELASSGNAYMYSTGGRFYLCVAGQEPMEINDPELASKLMNRTIEAKKGGKVTESYRTKADSHGRCTIYYSDGTSQLMDVSDPANPKPLGAVSFVAPKSISGGSDADPAGGITPEGTASFNEYLEDKGWKRNPTTGLWEQTTYTYTTPPGGGRKVKTPHTETLTQQEYRDNLLRYGSTGPSAFTLKMPKDYTPGKLVDTEADLAKMQADYAHNIDKSRAAYGAASAANSSETAGLFSGLRSWWDKNSKQENADLDMLADSRNWDDKGFIGDLSKLKSLKSKAISTSDLKGLTPTDPLDKYYALYKRTNGDLLSDVGLGAGGLAAGLGTTALLRNSNLGLSRAVHSLGKSMGLTSNDYDKEKGWTKWLDYGVGGALGLAGGLLTSELANNRFKKRRANRNITERLNNPNLDKNTRKIQKPYEGIRHITDTGEERRVF